MKQLRKLVLALAAFAAAGVLTAGASGAEKNAYVVHNLVSDVPGMAAHTDSNLVNAWGLAASATSPWWTADNGTDLATVYNAAGVPFPPPPASPIVVQVPGGPTGEVANSGPNFVVGSGAASGPARFLFATEDGTILGWNPTASPSMALVGVPAAGAVYKGLAIAGTNRLYATDFHNDKVDVFDGNFQPVTIPGAFADPGLPAGFAPFDIQNVGGRILVSYAKQDADRHDDVPGQGLGFVDAFDTNGMFLQRIATRGQLNSPWGLAQAPAGFGRFSGDLLVGNFGNGKINAYAPQADGSYERVGLLKRVDGTPIVIDGLWALQFGHGAPNNGSLRTLFFTAGPDGESHGLFGSIDAQ
jgi:uncharacterized protein (TIGR03118 family)